MSRLLTRQQVQELVPYSNTHLLRKEEEGTFPKRIKPGGTPKSKSFWDEDEVLEWKKTHLGARR